MQIVYFRVLIVILLMDLTDAHIFDFLLLILFKLIYADFALRFNILSYSVIYNAQITYI